jgi:hypothetical protein
MMTEAQVQQRRQALRQANTVRTQRAEIKRRLAEGELTLAQLLSDPPPAVCNATIGEVLEWAPGIGEWRSKRILGGGQGSPGVGRTVHVEHLSEASKSRILARFEEWVPLRYAPCG